MSIRLQSTTKTVGNPNKKSLRSYSTQNEQENGWKSSPTSFARYWVTRENGLSAERYSAKWWWEALVLCVVFAITGSSTMYFVRPFMREALNLEGSLKDGPWSYRIAYFTVMMPIYSVILVTVGTIFGRHQYFKKFAIKMWSRMIPERVKKSMGF